VVRDFLHEVCRDPFGCGLERVASAIKAPSVAVPRVEWRSAVLPAQSKVPL